MFYNPTPTKDLRFGDIVAGFSFFTPAIDKPLERIPYGYNVDIEVPKHCVVLTPCCSIKDRLLCLTPLIKIKKQLIENPYFKEDLTRINRKVDPLKSIPPKQLDKETPEEKARRAAQEPGFAFGELFIYQGHDDYLPDYSLSKEFSTNYYMIDFRNVHRINCKSVIKANRHEIDSKVLELSVSSRKDLRLKISYFYFRPADEDLADL